MKRKIIKIDLEKCNGCGACASACHEGAIGMVNGKAVLLREDFCDGLGDCLPACPTQAISFEERDAAPYDQEAVQAAQQKKAGDTQKPACSCPGTRVQRMRTVPLDGGAAPISAAVSSLAQWPCQIKLVPVNAPYLDDADLLIAADCAAYAFGDFHHRFMRGRITLIGCPKLDAGDYAEKLTQIFRAHRIGSVTVARMEVPCCSGIERAVKQAVQNSGQNIPVSVVTISTDGNIL